MNLALLVVAFPLASLPAQDEGAPSVSTAIVGRVTTSAGEPARGAVVVSSAGGESVCDSDGAFWLDVELPLDARSVRLTAVEGAGEARSAASSVIPLAQLGGVNQAGLLTLAQGACQPSWVPEFGIQPGVAGWVYALAVFDDGGGPALFAGGRFASAGGVVANHVAKWDGARWSPLGTGIGGFAVYALAVFDDGSGPALYVAGEFTTAGSASAHNIARWDGTSWSRLAGGVDGEVDALVVFDDGSGPALYAGGQFLHAGSVKVNCIARWDGTRWSRLARGRIAASAFAESISALAVFDGGHGPALYAGGVFRRPGGESAGALVCWSGSGWSPVNHGIDGEVQSLVTFQEPGSPTALYAGGTFTDTNGVPTASVGRWDGTSWSELGPFLDETIQELVVFDDGTGLALHAGSNWDVLGSTLVKWDGASWTPVGTGTGHVRAMAVFDDGLGAGPRLHVGGGGGEILWHHVARWDGNAWSELGNGLDGDVRSLAVFDDGSGPALYAGGDFDSASGSLTQYIAKWNGASWTAVGDRLSGGVNDLAVYDDGGGSALYAAAQFSLVGSHVNLHIARWDGATWSPLGQGTNGPVNALVVFDDGSGPALFVGGAFSSASGVSTSNLARWNGAWSSPGGGTSGPVHALAVYDDGRGPALYAGGAFTIAGSVSASRIARWNGLNWQPLASGMNDAVYALTTLDDGSGTALYAGGRFTVAGGGAARRVARWDGHWSKLGSGLNDIVYALAAFDDGGGTMLHAGGAFILADNEPAKHLARWDGVGWSPLGSGTNDEVLALEAFDDGSAPALFAGGRFTGAIDSGDSFLARWQGCRDTAAPVISCPSSFLVRDPLASAPGELVFFSVTAIDDLDPTPTILCTPPSGSFFAPGTTLVQCTATDAAGNRSSCSFQVSVGKFRRE